jgi:transmembrane sensor
MTPKEFKTLYERCISGRSTPEEQKLFEEYKDNFNLIDTPWTAEMGDYESTKATLIHDLEMRLTESKTKRLKKWYWVAAASLLIGFTAVIFITKRRDQNLSAYQLVVHSSTIKPGRNQAILILANNSRIVLDDSKDGAVSTQSHVTIVKDKNNRLVYKKAESVTPVQDEVYNTIITPRGGQYELVLSDGTKVWMNADSRLKYPVSFTGKDRVVQLEGEAYFEVAKNKLMPFKVLTGEKTVEVLGTHFNVNAYPDEPYQTTLLEGSVQLSFKNGPSTVLSPGDQGILNSKQQFNVIQVNAIDAVAWKNGIFLFKKENIQSVMKKISRWYNVEVYYQGDVYNKKLGGTVSRYENISDLLKTIQLTENVHFKINGRRVTVMP